MVKNYLGNNGQKVKKSKNPFRSWSISQVVGKLHKEEVERLCQEKSGEAKGTKAFISVYQKVLAKFVEELTDDDRVKYGKMAKEWTEKCPPKEIQRE